MTNLNFRVAQAITFGLLVFSTVLLANAVRGEENEEKGITSITTFPGSYAVPDNSIIQYSDGSTQWCNTYRGDYAVPTQTICN
jgi:hypothetical protein